jgi:hypothetical protein
VSETRWVDNFDRGDTSSVGNGWQESAGLSIVDGAVRAGDQAFAGDTTLGLVQLANESPHTSIQADLGVQVRMAITNDSGAGDTRGAIILRGQQALATDCYLVRLGVSQSGVPTEDEWTLSIVKVNAGTETILITLDVTDEIQKSSAAVDAWKNEMQSLGARVTDDGEDVRIEAFLNGPEGSSAPILTWNDNAYPQWRGAGYVGFQIKERADLVILDSIEIGALTAPPSVNETADAIVSENPWTFGHTWRLARTMALRDSNSSVDDGYWQTLTNAAEQEIALHVGRVEWAAREHSFFTQAARESYELPPEFSYVDESIWDVGNGTSLTFQPPEDFRRLTGGLVQGRPFLWRKGGRGTSGGILLAGYPVPDQEYEFRIRGHTRPRFHTTDDEPMWVPPDLCMVVVWGAIKDYAGRDSDRTHIAFAQARWTTWVARIRLQNQQKQNVTGKSRVYPDIWPNGFPQGGLRGFRG